MINVMSPTASAAFSHITLFAAVAVPAVTKALHERAESRLFLDGPLEFLLLILDRRFLRDHTFRMRLPHLPRNRDLQIRREHRIPCCIVQAERGADRIAGAIVEEGIAKSIKEGAPAEV